MAEEKRKILVVDDDHDICLLLDRFLTKNGFEITIAHSGNQAKELFNANSFDLIMSDYRLGDMDGLELLQEVKKVNPNIAFIIITGYSDIKTAVKVIKLGAFDYVTKPLLPDEILATIRKAINQPSANKEHENKSNSVIDKKNETELVTGNSKEAKELVKQIELVAPTNYSVIIFGETGTGKESIARTIHQKSTRNNEPFIALDCGALSNELASSELFGHEKGAFTGAIHHKIGHFELANGGTLFLDEVSNLSFEIQTSLLRVLQEQKVKKIGATKETSIDVRIIVASNENLSQAVAKGKFREDLFHRLNQFDLQLTPLRDRGKDIVLFAEYFLKSANKELNKNIFGFEEEVVNSLNTYHWPGNLREMNNVIRRAALLCNDSYIEAKHIPHEIINNISLSFSDKPSQSRDSKKTELNLNLKVTSVEAEYETIVEVLKKVQFNKTKAAKLLQIDRKTLYNKMKAYNLLSDAPQNKPE